MIKRIHVRYRLEASPEAHETVLRVHEMHKDFCPVYRSIGSAIAMTTEVRIEPVQAGPSERQDRAG